MKPHGPPRPALPRRITLVEQTAETLRAGIKLCAELQVGRNTLRAALKELQRGGWLQTATGRQRTINRKRVRTTSAPRPHHVRTTSAPRPHHDPSRSSCWHRSLRRG